MGGNQQTNKSEVYLIFEVKKLIYNKLKELPKKIHGKAIKIYAFVFLKYTFYRFLLNQDPDAKRQDH